RLSRPAWGDSLGSPRRSGLRMPYIAPAAEIAPSIASLDLDDDGRPARGTDPTVLVAERIAVRSRSILGLRHTLVAPLTSDEGQIGALLVSRRTAGGWPPGAQRVLNGAAVAGAARLSRPDPQRE